MKEAAIRIITTDYNHGYVEIPTQGWKLSQRWNWVKAILTGGDIVHRPKYFQHIDLRVPTPDDSKDMP